MKNRGSFRNVMARVAEQLTASGAPRFTWSDLYERAPVEPGLTAKVAKVTHRNMVRAGEIKVVGTAPRPHARRPMALCELAPREGDALADLEGVMRHWHR